jgi:GNAT superfamily N-acetyltransferase
MTDSLIAPARTPAEIDAVRHLCHAFVRDQLETFPEQRGPIEQYYGSKHWLRVIDNLDEVHARPEGEILLARADGVPAGCIMYLAAGPGTAEIQRLFVAPDQRGSGLGRALVKAVLDCIRADGYDRVQLESASFLKPAQALYRDFGFRCVPAFHDHPLEVAAINVPMACGL